MTTTQTLDTFSAIMQRRSVKYYDPDYRMSEAEVNKLLELALLSPTSFNMQNWRFVVVQDQALKEEIWLASWKQNQVKDASLLLVLCADLNAHERNPERYWANAPEQVSAAIVPMIKGFYKDNAQLQRDEAMRSTGIASQTLMLAAKAMGYDSCPMVGFDPKKVAEIIKLPEDHIISMLLPIGKAKEAARERAGQLALSEVVITNTF
ncbi:MAG: nitroreductase family protein [Candidatus Melainabacteria bacterium]|nr:nitroreductase family protein [Candidatus Melainabacteria bacterium]